MKTRVSLAGLLLLVMLIGGCFGGSSSSSGSTPPKSTITELNASVRASATEITVTNKDSFDWLETRFELNAQGLKSGYVYNAGTVKAGAVVKVPMREFTLGNGTRFNSATTKPLNFGIWCKLPTGNGSWYGGWD